MKKKQNKLDGLDVEESIDGITYLKKSLMKKLKDIGLIDDLPKEDFYKMNQVIGTHIDFVASKIDFTYSQRYLKKQKELERQKDDFMGIVSHELKTPVTSLKAYGQLLQKRMVQKGDMRTSQNLGKMDTQINRLSRLIHDLLDITKIEGKQLKFHDDYFEFDDMVKEVIDEVQRSSVNHKILLRGKTETKIRGDRERIGQVLINMLMNAIKFSPTAYKVLVETRVTKGEIHVSVIDQGVGIAKANQPRIFERFYREAGAKQETFPGIGVGLYISREILARHNGKIWLKSQKGKGSRFYFSLPIGHASQQTSQVNNKIKNAKEAFNSFKKVMQNSKYTFSV